MTPEQVFGRTSPCGPAIPASVRVARDLAFVRDLAACPDVRREAAERALGLVARGEMRAATASQALFAIAFSFPETSPPYRTAITLLRDQMRGTQVSDALGLRRPHILG